MLRVSLALFHDAVVLRDTCTFYPETCVTLLRSTQAFHVRYSTVLAACILTNYVHLSINKSWGFYFRGGLQGLPEVNLDNLCSLLRCRTRGFLSKVLRCGYKSPFHTAAAMLATRPLENGMKKMSLSIKFSAH